MLDPYLSKGFQKIQEALGGDDSTGGKPDEVVISSMSGSCCGAARWVGSKFGDVDRVR